MRPVPSLQVVGAVYDCKGKNKKSNYVHFALKKQ